jgi:type I restriction enzyme S subunit
MAICTTTTASQLQSSFIRLDAEFFRPEYMVAALRLNSIPGVTQLGRFASRITQGSNPRFVSHGVPCVNGKNVYFGTMLEGEPNYVSAAEYERLSGYSLQRNDLVITLKHATKVGRVWIVEDDEPRIFSRNVGLVRLRDDSPIRHSVLLLYLWTKAGQLLIDRCATGGTTGQITLPMSELRRVPIPPITDKDQDEIDALFSLSRKSAALAVSQHHSACRILESELGLDKLIFQKPVGFIAQFSEALNSKRIDADYFQTPFRQIDDHLDKYSTAKLHTLVDIVKGIEVGSSAYKTEGHPFLRVSNIKETGIELGPSDKYISPALYAALQSYRPQIGELLLTKDGSPGVAMAVDQDCDGIISGGVVRLKPKTDEIPIEYLALAINSRACRMQIERECSGALILHWKPSLIRKLRIPVLPAQVMYKIAELVTEAKRARRKSDELLDQAKTRVEQLIEAAVQP